MYSSRSYGGGGGGYFAACRQRRSKTDWAGIDLGDAFKSNLGYYLRIAAQRLFNQITRKVQLAVFDYTGGADGPEPQAKPQLSPFYTNYPSTLAAHAAIGLTAYLEFKARMPEKILLTYLKEYLEKPAAHDDVRVDPKSYEALAKIIAELVQARVLLEDLSRYPFGASVEMYRLFSASQQNAVFRTVPDMLQAVILYGDILPDWRDQELHPLTRQILGDLTRTCNPYFDTLSQTPPPRLVYLGVDWVKALCRALVPYLPEPEEDSPEGEDRGERGEGGYRFNKGSGRRQPTERFAPLDAALPPSLFDPVNPEQAVQSLVGGNNNGKPAENDPCQQLVNDFADAVNKASGQQQTCQDIRSDVLEQMLTNRGFCESPIQGNPVEGHEVSLKLGREEVAGEIFDRPVELSFDEVGYSDLLRKSEPIAQCLRKNLYPNVEQIPETSRLQTSGLLDGNRLAMADYSQVIFRRYRIREQTDPRGKPVVLIVCDGSGSLSQEQMQMLKFLTAGWLESTVKSEIQVLAGLYHTGNIRPGVSGALVQWIYHPQKTPALTRKEASRSLVSLPPHGTGHQHDALSLAFMLEEARCLARGRMIYLILLTDCGWCSSFKSGMSAKDEVYAFFENAYRDFAGRFHTTLVGLGVSGQTGFEELLDKVLVVTREQLTEPAAVAGQIGAYVASCLRERRRWVVKK